MNWTCPRCQRNFRQVNQRHACGVGTTAALLANRSPELVTLYRELESAARSYGTGEIVTRDRYALFRTTRIFADLTVTRDALRVVIHLDREVDAPCFSRTGRHAGRVSHVALVRTDADLRAILPFMREALELTFR